MGNCLCIPKKHRNSCSGTENEKNGTSEEPRLGNGVQCEENSETFVSQDGLSHEDPAVPPHNNCRTTDIYVCPTVSSSILLRYDDEDEEITTELAEDPNKCDATEKEAEPNDVTPEPTSSGDQISKGDQTPCTSASAHSESEVTITKVHEESNGKATHQKEEKDAVPEPNVSDDLTSSTDTAPFSKESLDSENRDAAANAKEVATIETSAVQVRLIEVQEVGENKTNEPTSIEESPITEMKASFNLGFVKETEVEPNQNAKDDRPIAQIKVIEVQEVKEVDNAVSVSKKNNTDRDTKGFAQSHNTDVVKKTEAKSETPISSTVRDTHAQGSNDDTRNKPAHIAIRNEASKKAENKPVAGHLPQDGLEESNKDAESAAPVRVIEVKEVKNNQVPGETVTSTKGLLSKIDNKNDLTKHIVVEKANVSVGKVGGRSNIVKTSDGHSGQSATKDQLSQQNISNILVQAVTDGSQLGKISRIQGASTQNVLKTSGERKTSTGLADVEVPTTELALKGAMSCPTVTMKNHASSHIKEFGALLNVLSALKIPQQKTTSDSIATTSTNNTYALEALQKATSDITVTPSTSKPNVFGPQSDSSDKFGVYKSKRGIENWLQQSNQGTSSHKIGESNTSVTTAPSKKVSDFDIPKKARKPPPSPLVLKKPSPHLYSIPAIAKSDPGNKVNWTQLEAKGPQTEVLWTTKPTAFNVKLPPLPKRLLERKGSVEKLQESWVLPQVKQIETLKRECGRFPGLVVSENLRDKYSVEIKNVPKSAERDVNGADDNADRCGGTSDTADKCRKERQN